MYPGQYQNSFTGVCDSWKRPYTTNRIGWGGGTTPPIVHFSAKTPPDDSIPPSTRFYHFEPLQVEDLLLPSFHRGLGEGRDRVEQLMQGQILQPMVLCCQVHVPG